MKQLTVIIFLLQTSLANAYNHSITKFGPEEFQKMPQCEVDMCRADDSGKAFLNACVEAPVGPSNDYHANVVLAAATYGYCYCPCSTVFMNKVKNFTNSCDKAN